MSTINDIKELVKYLPNKDKVLAEKFIDNRDFSNLRDLIRSLEVRVKRNKEKEYQNPEYASLDINKIEELMFDIDFYIIDVYEDDVVKKMFDSEEY